MTSWLVLAVLLFLFPCIDAQAHLANFRERLNSLGVDPARKPDNVSSVKVQLYIYEVNAIPDVPEALSVDLWVWLTYTIPQWGNWKKGDQATTAGGNGTQVDTVDELQISSPSHERLFFWVPPHQFDTTTVYTADDTIGSSSHFVTIHNDGRVEVKKKITAETMCEMDFRAYPFDKQQCFLRLVFDEGIQLEPIPEDASDFLLFDGDIRPASIDTLKIKTYNLEIGSLLTTGDEECTECARVNTANLRIYLKREPLTYFLKHQLPLITVTVLSLLSLWIDVDCAPARAILSVTALLSLLTFIPRAEQGLPEGVHLTITGMYINICLLFVLADVLIFVILAWLSKLPDRKWETVTFKRAKQEYREWARQHGIEVAPQKEGKLKRFRKKKQDPIYGALSPPGGTSTEDPVPVGFAASEPPGGFSSGRGRTWGVGALRGAPKGIAEANKGLELEEEYSDSGEDEYVTMVNRQRARHKRRRELEKQLGNEAQHNHNHNHNHTNSTPKGVPTLYESANKNSRQYYDDDYYDAYDERYDHYRYDPAPYDDSYYTPPASDDEYPLGPPYFDQSPPHTFEPLDRDTFHPRIKVFWCIGPLKITPAVSWWLDRIAKGLLPLGFIITTVVFFIVTPIVRNPALKDGLQGR